MRLWSLHPKYLDSKGLVALWREALLAQKVLQGKTRGYKNHPQLERFKNHSSPKRAIAAYLEFIWQEAEERGYFFDKNKIGKKKTKDKILVTRGQITYEFKWLCKKLKIRDRKKYKLIVKKRLFTSHPFFKITAGAVENWEKAG